MVEYNTPEEYIQSLPEDRAQAIQTLHNLALKAMPGLDIKMYNQIFWGGSEQHIIGYGECVFINSKKEEVRWFLIGITHQKNYISVYVNAVKDREYLAIQYVDKLGKAKVGKSVINFKNIEDINLEVLSELLEKAKEYNA